MVARNGHSRRCFIERWCFKDRVYTVNLGQGGSWRGRTSPQGLRPFDLDESLEGFLLLRRTLFLLTLHFGTLPFDEFEETVAFRWCCARVGLVQIVSEDSSKHP